jgi:prepilin-type processing-associated H-X9-DG protein
MPAYDTRYYSIPPGCAAEYLDRSYLVALLPFLEQAPFFQAINADVSIQARENRTVFSVSIGVFACPSDTASGYPREMTMTALVATGQAAPGEQLNACFTSYLAMHGTYPVYAFPNNNNHCRVDEKVLAQADGCFIQPTRMPLSAVSDGLSQTLFVVERATSTLHGFDQDIFGRHGWYFIGNWTDTLGTTFFPPNAWRKTSQLGPLASGASSMHPGGLNVLMGDGSVRFVRDSIETWKFDFDAGLPIGVTPNLGGWWDSTARPGLWQALGTRAGGEVVSLQDLP